MRSMVPGQSWCGMEMCHSRRKSPSLSSMTSSETSQMCGKRRERGRGQQLPPLSEFSQHCSKFLKKLASPCRGDTSRQLWPMFPWDLASEAGWMATASQLSLYSQSASALGMKDHLHMDCLQVTSLSNKTVKIPQGRRGIWDKHSLPDIAKESMASSKWVSWLPLPSVWPGLLALRVRCRAAAVMSSGQHQPHEVRQLDWWMESNFLPWLQFYHPKPQFNQWLYSQWDLFQEGSHLPLPVSESWLILPWGRVRISCLINSQSEGLGRKDRICH